MCTWEISKVFTMCDMYYTSEIYNIFHEFVNASIHPHEAFKCVSYKLYIIYSIYDIHLRASCGWIINFINIAILCMTFSLTLTSWLTAFKHKSLGLFIKQGSWILAFHLRENPSEKIPFLCQISNLIFKSFFLIVTLLLKFKNVFNNQIQNLLKKKFPYK